MILDTVGDYAHYLAETFGTQIAVAEMQLNCTRVVVNTLNGSASAMEALDGDFQKHDPLHLVVTRARCLSESTGCHACSEDDAYAEWRENTEHCDIGALSDEIQAALAEAGVTDSSVKAWGLSA